ncbi:hypothetical protein [Halopelagius longus]|uniref:Uncharacterized protein n=1 Tax=Halopelagius longus TaxID=1236180 RepID=A0A1H0Z9I9_9EURY|nr:hypothetical protein [Halopelagius longus]RDI72886.1 hypothetical protein DWB78_14780 [Halopelagius longus]SDQ23796.1 hypothetical protein SAMN05216278_1081 [Halopelagius longus]
MAVLIPLAGCGSAVTAGGSSEPTEQPTPEPTPVPTATSTPTSTPTPLSEGNSTSTQELSLETLAEEEGVDAVGLNESTKRRVRGVLANFSENLPENESERRDALLATADETCRMSRQNFTESVNVSQVENDSKEAKKLARRLSYSSQIVNERFTDDVPVSNFKRLREGTDKATKYVPVLGSVNRFFEASCAASMNPNSEEKLRDFQVAAMMVGVDLVLAYSGVGYSPAFKGTRFVMNKGSQVGLYRLRYVCGNRCWGLAWSETHWIIRGEMVSGIHDTAKFAANSGLTLTGEDITYLAERQGLNKSQMVELASRLQKDGIEWGTDLFDGVEGCLSEVNVSDASKDPEKAVDDAKDAVGSFLGGSENKSETTESSCRGDIEQNSLDA